MLVHKYGPKLMAICMRYMQDEAKAKDALQNCFITVFRQFDGFKEDSNLDGWLKRVAVTSALKELRGRKNSSHSLDVVGQDPTLLKVEPIALDQLNKEDVLKKINSLAPDYRVAFNMFIIEGFTYQEMAEILEIKESTCRMKVSRARKKMQILIRQDYLEYENARSRKVD